MTPDDVATNMDEPVKEISLADLARRTASTVPGDDPPTPPPPAPPTVFRRTYLRITGLAGPNGATVADVVGEAPVKVPHQLTVCTANFRFAVPFTLVGGRVYFVRFWEQGHSHVVYRIQAPYDRIVNALGLEVARNTGKSCLCWVTVETHPSLNTPGAPRSGSLMLRGNRK